MLDADVFWKVYDDLAGSRLDESRWTVREAPGPDGEIVRRTEPTAVWTYGSEGMRARVPRFTRFHDTDQGADHGKIVILSTKTFPVLSHGTLIIRADMAVQKLGGSADDFLDGMGSVNVVDPDTGLIMDIVSTGTKVGAIYEKSPYDSQGAFAYVIDSPLHAPIVEPGQWHRACVIIDAARRTAHWVVDDVEIFAARDLPIIPTRVLIGMGALTVRRLRDNRSTSLRGQGLDVRWKDITVGTR